MCSDAGNSARWAPVAAIWYCFIGVITAFGPSRRRRVTCGAAPATLRRRALAVTGAVPASQLCGRLPACASVARSVQRPWLSCACSRAAPCAPAHSTTSPVVSSGRGRVMSSACVALFTLGRATAAPPCHSEAACCVVSAATRALVVPSSGSSSKIDTPQSEVRSGLARRR
ncbi:hypothetical protein D3C86_956450 [compost metagenome]